ncbi:flavin reductase (NADPH) [Pyrgilauda ruficollis]|uniref:flavin reductase (NADPH) n=1 Tax=Pyrgilauda ruficollis TaxID=221976 RepID=UPI001B87C5CF|nr:flavin reductase (NADPH) [Pyrgilauda ruficollis]
MEKIRQKTRGKNAENRGKSPGVAADPVFPADPGDPVDQPLTGDYEVSVGAAGGPGSSRVISAPDLGHFLLRCLRDAEFDGKSVYVSRHYAKE